MRRNVLGAGRLVKQRRREGGRGPGPRAAFGLAGVLISLLASCGGAPPAPPKAADYGERVANCIDSPRPMNDAAQGRMMKVQPGLAVLGSLAQERAQARVDYGPGGEHLFENEAPVRRAYVDGFRMDQSPVTAELYAEFAAACGVFPPDATAITQASWEAARKRFGLTHAYAELARFLWQERVPLPGRERHPMVLVSHDEAGFYCAWRGARLPTELEWERAARGPTGNIYPWGNRYDGFRVNTKQRGQNDTIEVGTLKQGNSPEGFTDMGGNVMEWTSTPWPGRPELFVVKGNGWDGRGGFGRGAARRWLHGDAKDITLGFRCAAKL